MHFALFKMRRREAIKTELMTTLPSWLQQIESNRCGTRRRRDIFHYIRSNVCLRRRRRRLVI